MLFKHTKEFEREREIDRQRGGVHVVQTHKRVRTRETDRQRGGFMLFKHTKEFERERETDREGGSCCSNTQEFERERERLTERGVHVVQTHKRVRERERDWQRGGFMLFKHTKEFERERETDREGGSCCSNTQKSSRETDRQTDRQRGGFMLFKHTKECERERETDRCCSNSQKVKKNADFNGTTQNGLDFLSAELSPERFQRVPGFPEAGRAKKATLSMPLLEWLMPALRLAAMLIILIFPSLWRNKSQSDLCPWTTAFERFSVGFWWRWLGVKRSLTTTESY